MFEPFWGSARSSRAPPGAMIDAGSTAVDTDCIAVLDPFGVVRAVNPTWSLATDLERPLNPVGCDWAQLWPADIRVAASDAIRRARLGLASSFAAHDAGTESKQRWFDVYVDPVCGADGRVTEIRSKARDVTLHRLREQELQRSLDEKTLELTVLARQLDVETARRAEAAARAAHADRVRLLGQFAGGIIHDFNNVLTVLNGASAMLLRDGVTQRQARVLRDIKQAIAGAAQLSRRLMDFSRLDSTEQEEVALPDFLDVTAALLSHLIRGDVELALEVDENCWPILVSPSALRAVILNLAANAGDAMPNGGKLTISARNCYSTERPTALAGGDYVHLSLRDAGCGMAEDVLAHAGEAFYTTKRLGKGTGLGLTSAFELAEQHSGLVLITSSPGVGTTINLYLPRAGFHREVDACSEPPVDRSLHGDAAILVIARDLTTRSHLTKFLTDLDYRVVAAERGDVALALLASGVQPNLALVDLQHDQDAGAPLAAQLRRSDPTLPIVFLADSPSMLRLQGELIFRKPVAKAEIVQAIQQQLGRVPGSIAPAQALRASDRLRDRIRNPRIRAVYDQWRGLVAGLGHLPSPGEADSLRHDIEDDCCLLQVERDQPPQVFRFVYVGSALTRRLGRDLVGTEVTVADQNVIGSLAVAYQRGLSGLAHFDYARFPLEPGVMLLFERLILPLSDDGRRVSHLAGLVTFDEISNDSSRIIE